MLKIERNQHSVIVYDEENSRGLTFPNERDTDVNLYIAELQERAQVIKPGTVLVPLLFDPQYKENNRPMQLFLETHSMESMLQEDDTAKELYKFYFAHAVPQISPAGVSYIFCKWYILWLKAQNPIQSNCWMGFWRCLIYLKLIMRIVPLWYKILFY